ncbi:MAG TPA: M50 family metallopeptidase [Anaerolineae bacterium]
MNEFVIQAIAFLIVLGPLVLLHEFGHFIFAKRAGIRVLEFGIGFPPRVRKLWRGKGALTIGSTRVEIPRNFPLPGGLADGKLVRAAAETIGEKLVLKSIVVLEEEAVTVPPAGQFSVDETRLYGEVSRFDPGTEYTLNWLPIGGFVKMLGEEDPSAPDSFAAAPKRHRTAVLLAGPGMNVVAALLIFTLAFMLGQPVVDPKVDKVSVVVSAVTDGTPAQEAGLEPGMVILAADGLPVDSPDTLRRYTDAHAGRMIELTVMDASDVQRTIRVLARTSPPEGQGRMGITLGLRAETFQVEYASLPEAFSKSVQATADTLGGIIAIPRMLIAGEITPDQARPVGPAGIAQIAGYALVASFDQGLPFQLLFLAGSISVALALTNLLPLPALDGGRLVFILIEAIRGRRVSPEREAIVHFAGMMFLLALFVLITVQDLSNPIQNIYR